MFNEYELKARLFPAFLAMFPIVLFSHFYLYQKIPQFIDSVIMAKIFSDISILAIFFYAVMQFSRFVSKKFLQDNFFQGELHFPTTEYLLYSSDKYSVDRKEKIREKIKNDFGISLFEKNEEANNETEARKKINEAVALIRGKVRDGRLLLQHNIEYGFIRNLIGGLAIAIPFGLFDFFFFMTQKNTVAVIISGIIFLIYFAVLTFGKAILKYYAYNYADVLYNEYLLS
jgi:hypothetical protein